MWRWLGFGGVWKSGWSGTHDSSAIRYDTTHATRNILSVQEFSRVCDTATLYLNLYAYPLPISACQRKVHLCILLQVPLRLYAGLSSCIYSLSIPTVRYRLFLYRHKSNREIFCRLQIQYFPKEAILNCMWITIFYNLNNSLEFRNSFLVEVARPSFINPRLTCVWPAGVLWSRRVPRS